MVNFCLTTKVYLNLSERENSPDEPRRRVIFIPAYKRLLHIFVIIKNLLLRSSFSRKNFKSFFFCSQFPKQNFFVLYALWQLRWASAALKLYNLILHVDTQTSLIIHFLSHLFPSRFPLTPLMQTGLLIVLNLFTHHWLIFVLLKEQSIKKL